MSATTRAGFSLLEVLIAMVIGAVGILAVVQLNLNNVRATRAAYLQSLAINYARDMGERIEANKMAISVTGVSQYDEINVSTPAQTASCRTSAGCTAAEMAAHDLWEWKQAISGSASVYSPTASVTPVPLPAGAGEVCVESSGIVSSATATLTAAVCDGDGKTNPVTHVIRVHWQEQGSDHAVDYVVRVNPRHDGVY